MFLRRPAAAAQAAPNVAPRGEAPRRHTATGRRRFDKLKALSLPKGSHTLAAPTASLRPRTWEARSFGDCKSPLRRSRFTLRLAFFHLAPFLQRSIGPNVNASKSLRRPW